VVRDHPQLAAVGRLTLRQSLKCVRMVLWDERQRRLISFRELHAVTSATESNEASPVAQFLARE
jgi:acyl-lipid omega-6 desaturase (Delta-12 desaturase)